MLVIEPYLGNPKRILEILSGAKVTVLAIVFSMATWGVQQISDNHSSRLSTLFSRNPDFKAIFGLYITSITLDLALVHHLPDFSNLVFLALALNLTCVVGLWIFIKNAVYQTTPEGVMKSIKRDLSPKEYIRRMRTLKDKEYGASNPLLPVFTMTISASSNNESVTAKDGVKLIEDICSDVLDYITDLEDQKRFSDVEGDLFKPVLEDYLPEMALKSAETDNDKISRKIIRLEHSLGAKGLSFEDQLVSVQAASGLSTLLMKRPSREKATIHRYAVEELGDLMSDTVVYAAEHKDSDDLDQMLSRANYMISTFNQMDLLVRRDEEISRVYEGIFRDYFRQLEEVQVALINNFASEAKRS